jgi:predicted ATPase
MVTARPVSFATLLRRWRLAAALTQEELAERARISARAVSDLERGIATAPHRDTVQLLVEALELSEDDAAQLEEAVPRRRGPLEPAGTIVRFRTADLPAGPGLIGRAAEQERLQALLADGNLKGATRLVLLAGEPGIGKTRLLQEAARLGDMSGWTVLHAGCHRRGGHEPFAPLTDALGQHVSRLSRAARRKALTGCAWLVRLLPELMETARAPLPVGALLPEQESRLLRAAIARFLRNIGGPAGTLLLLDDLQWAPTDTIDLLSFLLGTEQRAPLRVAGAFRDTDIAEDDPLVVALADLTRSGPAEYRRLQSLSDEESDELLRTLAPGLEPDFRARMVQRTGGVPFFLVSSAQNWKGFPTADIPWDVGQSVRARLLTLPEKTREVVRIAALLGRVADSRTIGAVVGAGERELLDHLDTACRARLLGEEGAGTYSFSHDIVREAVEAEMSASRLREIHRQIAAVLQVSSAGTGGAAALAWHLLEAGDRERALEFALRAGDEAESRFAHHQAAAQFRLALDLARELANEARLAEAKRKLGGALRALGRCPEALEVLSQAATWYESVDEGEGLARTLVEMGRAHRAQGTAVEGIEQIGTAFSWLSSAVSTGTAAALAVTLAHLYFACGRFDELLATTEDAGRLAREAGDDAILAEAEMRRGSAIIFLGRSEEALQALERAIRLSESSGNLENLSRSLNNAAALLENAGRLEECIAYRRRAVAAAEQLGDPNLIAGMVSNLGGALQTAGRLDDAQGAFLRALDILRGVGNSWYLAYPLGGLAGIAITSGDLDQAERYAAEALAAAERTGDPERIFSSEEQLAAIEVARGEPGAARRRLSAVIERLGRESVHVAIVLPMLARAHANAGDLVAAEETVDQAMALMTATNERIRLVHTLRARAHLRMLQERWEEAALVLAEAGRLASELCYRNGEEYVREDLARLLETRTAAERGA